MYHVTQPTQIESLFALGEYLRDIREGQRLRIDEIAQKLHIRATYLKSLESGDWSDLPGQAYGRGYLRQYAEFLGLSADDVMLILERIQGKVTSRLHYFEAANTEQTPSHRTLWLSIVCVIILLIGWNFWKSDSTTEIKDDYTIPDDLSQALSAQSAVIPSPYPIAAQECLKLLQRIEDPCYMKQQAVSLPTLAKKIDIHPYD